MNMLTESIDGVIGVDTHRDTLAAAAVTAIGQRWVAPTPPPTPTAIGTCWTSPDTIYRIGDAGLSKGPAATAPGLPNS